MKDEAVKPKWTPEVKRPEPFAQEVKKPEPFVPAVKKPEPFAPAKPEPEAPKVDAFQAEMRAASDALAKRVAALEANVPIRNKP